ncbi:hypothetical protein LWX53_02870 [bacterium]|nr:hypothetical protein [bacterium]
MACCFMAALSCAGAAAEDEPFAPISPGLFPWSPLDALPPLQTDRETLAWRVESPSLAGNRRAAADWGNVPIAAGPAAVEDACPGQESRIFSIDPSVYGGYAGNGIFGGIQAAIGYAFFEPGAPGPFFAAGAAVERVVSHDASAGWNGRAAMVGGLAGALPFPWSVSLRALAGEAAANPRAELIAEAATAPADLAGIGQFRLAAATGCAVGALPNYPVSVIFRSSFELEGREYRGALAEGLAARAGMEAFWLPEDGTAAAAAGASVAAALRFGDKAGLSGRAGLRYDGLGKDGWKSLLRSPKAAASLSGDLGLSASCELPVLFARGRLFMSEAGSVEFFLKPYAEILLLRASGRELFISDNLHGDGGLELAMTVDADRRDALRLGAGFDLSPWMQGIAGFPGFGDFGIYVLFSIAI